MGTFHKVVGSFILAGWFLSIVKGLVAGDYRGLDLTTPVMLVFAGYMFGEVLIKGGSVTTDYIRYALIAGGFFVIGFNVSVIIHARQLVTYVWPWRFFMAGQSFFALAAVIGLHRHLGQPISWVASLVAAAIVLSIVSAIMLERAYKKSHPKVKHELSPVRIRR